MKQQLLQLLSRRTKQHYNNQQTSNSDICFDKVLAKLSCCVFDMSTVYHNLRSMLVP